MTVTLSGCRMSNRYWNTHTPGPDPGGSDPGGYPGRYGGGGNPEEGLCQGPYGPSRDPFSRQLGLLIPSEGGRCSSGAVSGSFRAPGSSSPSEIGRSDPWARGDPGVTASHAGGAGPWTGYEARSGSAYSARGGHAHGSRRSHDELSAIRAVFHEGGITPEDSIPWIFGDGFILRPVSTSCWLVAYQFFWMARA